MKLKRTLFITLTAVLTLAVAGTTLAAGPDPEVPATASQGTLEIVTLDNEITVSYLGTGYNIHRFSTLRLAVEPGQNDFDYFCGHTKYFVGNVIVGAGTTTTIALQPGECAEPVVSEAAPVFPEPTFFDLNMAYTIGIIEGQACIPPRTYSPNPVLQAQYASGYSVGSTLCNLGS